MSRSELPSQDLKHFIFEDNAAKESCSISLLEAQDPQYGLYIWPSAPVLAQFVWYNRKLVEGKKVLEIACGTALPGLVAAKCGGIVKLSDGRDCSDARLNAQQICKLNNVEEIPVLNINWGQFHPDILEIGSVDIILGSDCFYDSKDFEDILVTVAYLIENNPKAEFWTSYQERR